MQGIAWEAEPHAVFCDSGQITENIHPVMFLGSITCFDKAELGLFLHTDHRKGQDGRAEHSAFLFFMKPRNVKNNSSFLISQLPSNF